MSAPEKLIELLDELIPGFADEKYKRSLAEMLWFSVDHEHRHRYYEKSIALHTNEVEMMFGKVANFKNANRADLGRYFFVHRFSNFTGDAKTDYTNGYEPRPWMKAVLDGYLDANRGAEFRDGRGQRHKPLLAIRSTDVRGNRIKRWQGVEICNLIPVNVSNLYSMAERYGVMIQANTEGKLAYSDETERAKNGVKLKGNLEEVKTLIRQAEHFGGLPIQYQQSNTGRLYATGVNLQNCKSETRHAALAGFYDYDIAACHFSIMTQMAAKFGLRCAVIDDYVNNKTQIRSELAEALGLEVGSIKKVLTAMAYGARQSLDPADAIPKEIGKENAERLYHLDLYKALKTDLAKATDTILNNHALVKQQFVNAIGKALIVTAKGKQLAAKDTKRHTRMSHLMQGVEAAVLEVAARAFPNQIVLLQHDGFTTSSPINLAALHAKVAELTGYSLKFEEDQIRMPKPSFDAQFLSIKTKLEEAPKVNIHAGSQAFWDSLSATVGVGRDELLPPYPLPLDGIETPF